MFSNNEKIFYNDELRLLLQKAFVEGYNKAKEGDFDSQFIGWTVAQEIINDNQK